MNITIMNNYNETFVISYINITIIGLAYQSQANTQLPFLFWDGAFSCLWEQMISENS